MNLIRWYRLKRYLKKHFKLEAGSIHGPAHWQKVEDIGLTIARKNGADQEVVRLFAWLHDSCRINENHDEKHGERAAELAKRLNGSYLKITDKQFERLHFACKNHAHGKVSKDMTVGTCWDADRLDLGRVGINPEAEYMSTKEGKSICPKIGK